MKKPCLLISFSLVLSFAVAQETDAPYDSTFVSDSVSYDYDNSDADSTASYGYVSPESVADTRNFKDQDVSADKFTEEKWKKIVGEKNYEEKPKKESDFKFKKGNFFFGNLDPQLMKTISFILVFILFAFILFYVARNTRLAKSVKKMKVADIAGPVENIEELDTDSLLSQALANGDLRLAVRIQYLLLLKKLNDVGLIDWKKNKTNRDYLSELYGRSNTYDNVRDLTLAYELVWYGERSVSPDSFKRLSSEFDTVNQQITQVQPAS